MREKPYQIVNVITNETVAWCTYEEYVQTHAGDGLYDVSYRPGRKTKVKK